jgi:hypothetical protein
MSALDAIKSMRNRDFSDIDPMTRPIEQPEVHKTRSVHQLRTARNVIYYTCFTLMLCWNLYCLVFNLPALVNASTAMVANSTGNAWAIYAVTLANWFFPTVGLGMIALTAKLK